MNGDDAFYAETRDPEYHPDAPDGDAAREETAAEDDGSSPFEGWTSYTPPLDAYCTPDRSTGIVCADGVFRHMAVAPDIEAMLIRARRQAVEACWPVLIGGEYPGK